MATLTPLQQRIITALASGDGRSAKRLIKEATAARKLHLQAQKDERELAAAISGDGPKGRVTADKKASNLIIPNRPYGGIV